MRNVRDQHFHQITVTDGSIGHVAVTIPLVGTHKKGLYKTYHPSATARILEWQSPKSLGSAES